MPGETAELAFRVED